MIIYQEGRIIIINRYKNRFKRNGTLFKNRYIYANDLIKDGNTLQLGIHTTPINNIKLKYHKNLGIHAEMFGESLLDSLKLDVISNAFKKEYCGRSAASFVIVNQETYEFIGDNPAIGIGETNYAGNINVIAHSALEMDLSGQVVADSVGLNILSGIGEQGNFLRRSSSSENGKLIICFVALLHHVSACIHQSVCLRDTITIFVVWIFFFLLFSNFFSVIFCGLKGNQLISACLNI